MWRLSALRQAVIDVYNWLLPLVTINILWFLLSLTVVLLPPATAALYEVAYQAKKGHGPGVQSFLAAVRHWLLWSWLWGVGCTFVGVIAAVALRFYSAQQSDVLLIITGAMLIFVGCIQFYFWPYVMAQETPHLPRAIRNAAFTVLADPLLTLVYGGITLLLLVISVVLVAPMVLITPIMVAFLGVYSLLDWLDYYHVSQNH